MDAYKKANIFLQSVYRQKEAYLYELECCTVEGEATGTGYVVDSIRSTFYLLRKYSKYADVVSGAIALGNDTDTTAAITGGLAAVAYKDIPRQWLEQLRGKEQIQRLLPEQPITQ